MIKRNLVEGYCSNCNKVAAGFKKSYRIWIGLFLSFFIYLVFACAIIPPFNLNFTLDIEKMDKQINDHQQLANEKISEITGFFIIIMLLQIIYYFYLRITEKKRCFTCFHELV